MELILISIVALVVLGSVDRRLHPQPGQRRPVPTRRAPLRRKPVGAPAPHRVTASQVRPFLSLGPSFRR